MIFALVLLHARFPCGQQGNRNENTIYEMLNVLCRGTYLFFALTEKL